MSKKINKMTGRELAQYMGSDASDNDGDHMKELLLDAGHGEKIVSEISDTEWMKILRQV